MLYKRRKFNEVVFGLKMKVNKSVTYNKPLNYYNELNIQLKQRKYRNVKKIIFVLKE